MPVMVKLRLAVQRLLLACLVALSLSCLLNKRLFAEDKSPTGSLELLGIDFYQWRARYHPFSKDDIPRIERPLEDTAHPRDWSASSIAKQKATLEDFEQHLSQIDTTGWSLARRVDHRLMGSALARVRWELDVNPRWQRDPSFYLDQTLTALLESLVQPPPFDAVRSREILDRMQDIPRIIDAGKANPHAVRPFAALAIGDLQQIRPELERGERAVAPMLHDAGQKDGAPGNENLAAKFKTATERAILALE